MLIRYLSICRLLGMLLMMLSLSQLPPLAVNLLQHEHCASGFIVAFLVMFLVGVALWWTTRHAKLGLRSRDGFLVVTLLWLVLSLFSAIPFVMLNTVPISWVDALFESVSGLTTTGASVLQHLSTFPTSILYYRMQLHFLGGMGIIVLAVAVLPMLGIGGLQLYRAEVVGLADSDKLTPRMTHTAKMLWGVYVGIVGLAVLVYHGLGLSWFEAIDLSFTTVSTGGFSLYDNSFAHYHSVALEYAAIVFMLLGGTNFALHFRFIRQRRWSVYARNDEWRFYLGSFVVATVAVGGVLLLHGIHLHGHAFLDALFTVVSVGTTTGLTVADFSLWPTFVPFFLMFLALLGGCRGSTAGGLKMIRCLIARAQMKREIHRLMHPHAVLPVQIKNVVISEEVLHGVWGFAAAFFGMFVVLFLALLACHLDPLTAFSALAGCFSNMGAGLGQVAHGFTQLSAMEKSILIFAMLAGRLEIFTIIIVFMPSYWRQ